jgi:hypothetical protein
LFTEVAGDGVSSPVGRGTGDGEASSDGRDSSATISIGHGVYPKHLNSSNKTSGMDV